MIYRGILHNHSACSKEGCYALGVLRRRWADSLDFAAMTEHAERISAEEFASYVSECDALSDERFRFIPGLEVATTSGDMLLLGCREYICTRDPLQVLASIPQHTVVILAHPEEGKVQAEVLARIHAVEGWNGGHMGGFMPPVDWLVGWRKRQPTGKFFTGGNDIHKVDPKRKILTLVEVLPVGDMPTSVGKPAPLPCSEEEGKGGDKLVIESKGGDKPAPLPCSEEMILKALREGNFRTDNGIFSFTPDGTLSYKGGEVRWLLPFLALARAYRWSWRMLNAGFQSGGALLGAIGMDKQKRTRLNRLIRQHL